MNQIIIHVFGHSFYSKEKWTDKEVGQIIRFLHNPEGVFSFEAINSSIHITPEVIKHAIIEVK